ncbi:hypothetical protein [Streptomyces sp. WMMC1477]|uniref:hypothetical protein n=1 Tax=Streptomyces sp. WMMC1477 TaxID=3015155 RepID=UPI0022B62064|nr:hypothetical protein [Streptomyces sp. WMMC1477]MCZ7430146.1 hypothetical protein [Streptomyces sp. WMMC1477]
MDKARLYRNGTVGEKVFAHDIDDEPWWRAQKIPLVCAFCLTPVVSQRTSVGRNPRGALFRLARDRQHEQMCPLNPVEVLQKIAHGSQGVAVIEGDELHLVLPDDLGQIGATVPVIDGEPAAPGDRFGVDISTVRPLLPPLINSAVVIARFLQKHDYDADVVAQFKVRRPGARQAVSWREFCHGPTPGDHARLYGQVTSGPKPDHPVALYGRITAVEQDSQDRPVLRLADGRGFTVRIRSDHASLLAPLEAGVFVLAVGAWKVWTPRRGRRELQMFAEEHWQLAHWTYDAATGHSGPPACPPPLSPAQRALRHTRSAAATRKPAPRQTTRPSPKPRPNRPSTPLAPPPTAPPPAPGVSVVSATAASPSSPTPPPEPGPVVPEAAPPAPSPPPHPPQPPAPPQPTAPPRRRTRRRWWLFGRRR